MQHLKTKLRENPIIAFTVVMLVIAGFFYVQSISDDAEQTTAQENAQNEQEQEDENTTEQEETTTQASEQQSQQPSFYIADGLARVTYTNNGFSPTIIPITLRDSVRFVNQSGQALRIGSYDNPDYDGYDIYTSEFIQPSSMGYGEYHELPFSQEGIWWYQNVNNPEHRGAVIVTE